MNIKETWSFSKRNEKDLRLKCGVCGASTENKEAIESTVNNICPICFSFGSLTLEKKGDT